MLMALLEDGVVMYRYPDSGCGQIWLPNRMRRSVPAGVRKLSVLAVERPVRISRAGIYLKPTLVRVAHAAVKDKNEPYYALKYEHIAKRRGKKRAIIAIARMILTAIYSMFCTGEAWNPVDLFKIDMPEHLKEQQLAKAIKQATRFLVKQGLSVA